MRGNIPVGYTWDEIVGVENTLFGSHQFGA